MSSAVRARVAGNSHTPQETLAVLSHDDESGVRHMLIKNPNTPGSILWAMSRDRDNAGFLSQHAGSALVVRGLERSDLSGILKESVKGLSPYVLELDGMTGQMWLRGDVLKDIPANTRVWVRGVIRSEKYDPKPKGGMTAFPVQWHVYMDVFECTKISSPFEEPRKER